MVNNAKVFHNSSDGESVHYKTLSEVGLLNHPGRSHSYSFHEGEVEVLMSLDKNGGKKKTSLQRPSISQPYPSEHMKEPPR